MDYLKDWKLRENGDVILNPFVGWRVATAPQNQFLVQIRYLHHPGQSLETPDVLLLILTKTTLLEFCQELENLAKSPHKAQPPTDSRH